MINLYFSPTPNSLKAQLALEEAGFAYRRIPVRLSADEQYGAPARSTADRAHLFVGEPGTGPGAAA